MAKSSSSGMSRVITGAPEPRRAGPPPSYRDIDRIKSAEGIVAVISYRRSSGVITFGIFREYERDGVVEKTQFVPESFGPAYLEMVKLVIERIAQFRRNGIPDELEATASAGQ